MNEQQAQKRRNTIKNVAIVFLVIMLILTLYSKTFRNYSLPEVTMVNPTSETIKDQARGTGNLEAADPYTLNATESRVVSSVGITKGDHVDIGDVIYYLEDKESEELQKAKSELSELENKYVLGLFDGNASNETIIKARTGNYESLGSYQARLKEIDDRIESVRTVVQGYEDNLDVLKIQHTFENSVLNTYTQENIKARLTAQKENMQLDEEENFNYYKSLEMFDLDNKITHIDAQLEIETDPAVIEKLELEKNELNQMKTGLSSMTYTNSDDDYLSIAKQINSLAAEITVRTNENSAIKAKRDAAESASSTLLSNAQNELKDLESERTKLINDIAAEIKLEKFSDDIEVKKAEVERLEAQAMGATITAPVAGIVSELDKVAGEKTETDKKVATILPDGKGYTLSIKVDNKQAAKVKVSDFGEITNNWAFPDIAMEVKSIKDDPDNSGKSKIITFEVTGSDLAVGQSFTVSVGSKSQKYDTVVPNSAIRHSNSGDYVLTFSERKTPFGVRYIANRVDVTVSASDDTNSAISGAVGMFDYVITTESKLLNPGDEFRIKDN